MHTTCLNMNTSGKNTFKKVLMEQNVFRDGLATQIGPTEKACTVGVEEY